ncbi:MAG: hypothetical protein IJL87_02450, partial [Clostridia bacterium]|nr:hypothetical protein [Clostridia bacterium]
TDSEDEETVGYLSTIKSSGGYMNVNLELPVKPTDHNATTVSDDGKTLTWDLTTLGMNDKIYAEFDLPSNDISRVTESITSSPVLKWLLPVLGVVLVGAIVAIVASKNKKRKAAQQAAAVQNAVPYGAVPQQNNVVTEVPAQPVPADASAEIEAKTDEIIDAAQDAVADTPVEEIVSDITDGE